MGFKSGKTASKNTDVTFNGAVTLNGLMGFALGSDATISSGVLTITHSNHRVIPEGGSGSDSVDTINGGSFVGQLLILRKMPGTGTQTLNDGTGNLNLLASRALGNDKDTAVLMWTGAVWIEIAFANNA